MSAGRARAADARPAGPGRYLPGGAAGGRCEDGSPFTVRLAGTHLLIAGATGAGKGSWLWGLVRALLPAMTAGLVEVLACGPKLMELAFGRALFDAYGRYAPTRRHHGPAGRGRDRHAGPHPFTLAALKVHVEMLGHERAELGPDYCDHGLLFCWENGKPPHPDTITRRFHRLAEAAGLPKINLHDVRHN